MVVAGVITAFLGLRAQGTIAPDEVWGKKGVLPGDFVRPRAAALDRNGRLYIVDFTARIQAYDLDGKYLGITWQTPDYRNGRPSGLGIDRDGNVLVCDSHYHSVKIYSPEGQLLRSLGGDAGTEPGKFGYVSDCVQDEEGNYYISEFGQNDRITKLNPDGKFVATWGTSGTKPGEFQRVRALALGPDGLLYVADACNHRIQVFEKDGTFVRSFGEAGSEPGQLSYPYDLCFSPRGDLYVSERGNGRIQKFTKVGRSLGTWGLPGRAPGELADPWALVVDSKGRVHVIDTENHRVQRVRF